MATFDDMTKSASSALGLSECIKLFVCKGDSESASKRRDKRQPMRLDRSEEIELLVEPAESLSLSFPPNECGEGWIERRRESHSKCGESKCWYDISSWKRETECCRSRGGDVTLEETFKWAGGRGSGTEILDRELLLFLSGSSDDICK